MVCTYVYVFSIRTVEVFLLLVKCMVDFSTMYVGLALGVQALRVINISRKIHWMRANIMLDLTD